LSRIEVPGLDIVGLRADNPGPFTLQGTNSWLIGRAPTWLVDPGPALPAHIEALEQEIERRGGLGGIALTHRHPDHSEALGALRERHPAARVGMTGAETFGPLEALPTPGHAPDHLAFVVGSVALTGDAVLGHGSVFVAPYPGALAAYLEGLRRLRQRELELLCPGHGPLIQDPRAKLDEYLAHRLERQRRLQAALDAGQRSTDELLDEVWDDVPARLRFAAAITLAAHLDLLEQQGRLPAGVERPDLSGISWV
jgi:glyoxylase-like metal-dependent hydrolase (beta-lactamase superfamily II)